VEGVSAVSSVTDTRSHMSEKDRVKEEFHDSLADMNREQCIQVGSCCVVYFAAIGHISKLGHAALPCIVLLLHTLLHYCITALLHYCITALLHYCITAFLHFCITALLLNLRNGLVHYCIAIILHYCITALLYHLLLHHAMNSITAFLYYSTTRLNNYRITACLHYCISISLHYCITVERYVLCLRSTNKSIQPHIIKGEVGCTMAGRPCALEWSRVSLLVLRLVYVRLCGRERTGQVHG
jgi:hypothetical protein